MKAIVANGYGSVEVLELVDFPDPNPKPDQVLIKVFAASVNSGDVRVRALDAPGFMKILMRLLMGWNKPKQPILGSVFAGVVEQVGEKVTKFKVGDRVFGSTGFNSGCHAEKIVVQENSPIVTIPEELSFTDAAALIFGGQTAIHFIDKVKLVDKSKVMVYGASGAVGTMALQILRARGHQVTAVASEKNQDLLAQLGADKILNYQSSSFLAEEKNYDLIFDCVGFLPRSDAKPSLSRGGYYLTVAGTDVAKETKNQLQEIISLYQSGKLKPIIDRTFSMADFRAAHKLVESKRKLGSAVLVLAAE